MRQLHKYLVKSLNFLLMLAICSFREILGGFFVDPSKRDMPKRPSVEEFPIPKSLYITQVDYKTLAIAGAPDGRLTSNRYVGYEWPLQPSYITGSPRLLLFIDGYWEEHGEIFHGYDTVRVFGIHMVFRCFWDPRTSSELWVRSSEFISTEALTQLRDDNSPDDRFQKTKYTCFNPKAAVRKDPTQRRDVHGHDRADVFWDELFKIPDFRVTQAFIYLYIHDILYIYILIYHCTPLFLDYTVTTRVFQYPTKHNAHSTGHHHGRALRRKQRAHTGPSVHLRPFLVAGPYGSHD